MLKLNLRKQFISKLGHNRGRLVIFLAVLHCEWYFTLLPLKNKTDNTEVISSMLQIPNLQTAAKIMKTFKGYDSTKLEDFPLSQVR